MGHETLLIQEYKFFNDELISKVLLWGKVGKGRKRVCFWLARMIIGVMLIAFIFFALSLLAAIRKTINDFGLIGFILFFISIGIMLPYVEYEYLNICLVYKKESRKYRLNLVKGKRPKAGKRNIWVRIKMLFVCSMKYSLADLEKLQLARFAEIIIERNLLITKEWLDNAYNTLYREANLPGFISANEKATWALLISIIGLFSGGIGSKIAMIAGIGIGCLWGIVCIDERFSKRAKFESKRAKFLQMTRLLKNYEAKYMRESERAFPLKHIS